MQSASLQRALALTLQCCRWVSCVGEGPKLYSEMSFHLGDDRQCARGDDSSPPASGLSTYTYIHVHIHICILQQVLKLVEKEVLVFSECTVCLRDCVKSGCVA